MDRKRGIGYQGDLPWPKLKGDMRFFRELTTCPDRAAVEKRWGLKPTESAETKTWDEVSAMLKFAHPLPVVSQESRNVVVMGRVTYESLPEVYRPLPDRENVALSRYPYEWPNVVVNRNLNVILEKRTTSQIFVVGGGQVYSAALSHPRCLHLYITEIDAEFPCDTFFPETPNFAPALSSPWIDENGIRYCFRRYDRVSA